MTGSTALIVGVGDGLSASLTRLLYRNDYSVELAARDVEKLAALAGQTSARIHQCDATSAEAVTKLFNAIDDPLSVVIYNPSARVKGPIAELDINAVQSALSVTAFGAFLVGQQAAARMLHQNPVNGIKGTILFTGASAGVKGFPESAPFAMGKFAQRGLAQSMSRELHPKGIHVAWVNIDGAIRNPGRVESRDFPDSMLDPDAIADSYLALIQQDRSVWSSELTLRPWVEKF